MLERVVPPGGATHGGYFLPAGTVSCATNDFFGMTLLDAKGAQIIAGQAWSAHRRESTFPDPNAFLPERWLTEVDGKQYLKEDPDMISTYFPFGAILYIFITTFHSSYFIRLKGLVQEGVWEDPWRRWSFI